MPPPAEPPPQPPPRRGADRELVALIRARPGMYGLRGSYAQAVTLLTGIDIGRDGGLLRGFREYLVVRLGHPSSLGWPSLVLEAVLPGTGVRSPDRVPPERWEQAVAGLFDLVEAFLEVRDDAVRYARMYERYARVRPDRTAD